MSPAAPTSTPDLARGQRVAGRLLVVDAVLLAVSLPVPPVYLLGQLWESPDQDLLHRLVTGVLPLEVAALVTGIIAACAGAAVLRERGDAFALTVTTVVLALLQAAGWAVVLRGHLAEPTLAVAWLVTLLPPPVALVLLVRARRADPVGG